MDPRAFTRNPDSEPTTRTEPESNRFFDAGLDSRGGDIQFWGSAHEPVATAKLQPSRSRPFGALQFHPSLERKPLRATSNPFAIPVPRSWESARYATVRAAAQPGVLA